MTRDIASVCALLLLAQGCHLTYASFDYGEVDAAVDAGEDGGEPIDAGCTTMCADASREDAAPPDAGPGTEIRDIGLSCTSSSTVEQRGDPITVNWVALNTGTVSVLNGGSLVVEMLQPPMREGELDVWLELATDTFTATLTTTEAWSSSLSFPTPDWVAAGENRLRCSLRLDVPDDVSANDTIENSLVVTGLPDLVVTFVGNLGTAGTDVFYTASVENRGITAARNVRWTLRGRAGSRTISLTNGTFAYIPRTGGAGAGAMGMANYCPGSCLSGAGELLFDIDPADTVRESDETNNTGTSTTFTW